MTTPHRETQRNLAFAIVDFLQTSCKDGSVAEDEKESIDVAVQCIAGAFGVNPEDTAARKAILGGQNLLSIYSVFERTKKKNRMGEQSTDQASPSTASKKEVDLAKADEFKAAGNAAMSKNDFTAAIEQYSKALSIAPNTPVYLSNRAAAYSQSGDHSLAAADAEAAINADAKFAKAYSRLGLARLGLGDAKAAMDAYKRGIEAEGGNDSASPAMKRGYETAKRKVDSEGGSNERSATPTGRGGGGPDLASLAGMFGGGGAGGGSGGGGGGGMPDLASIMNNPAIANMAQSFMNSDAGRNLMSNPRVAEMASQYSGGGGGMPDMSQISQMMQDPAIRNIASQFMGGNRNPNQDGQGGQEDS